MPAAAPIASSFGFAAETTTARPNARPAPMPSSEAIQRGAVVSAAERAASLRTPAPSRPAPSRTRTIAPTSGGSPSPASASANRRKTPTTRSTPVTRPASTARPRRTPPGPGSTIAAIRIGAGLSATTTASGMIWPMASSMRRA